ncbi:MAG: ATP-binding protein [Xanthomonadales bacterium]|nr:ATP-binding protein [Xanthomonadales bacterium]
MTLPAGRWSVPADPAGLARLQRDAGDWLRRAGVADAAAGRVLLALDELAANIVHHAGLAAGACFEVELSRAAGGLLVRVSDAGPPFDPTAMQPVAARAALDEVTIGGFGLGLVRQLARSMEYRREGGRNHVSLCFGLAQASGAAG